MNSILFLRSRACDRVCGCGVGVWAGAGVFAVESAELILSTESRLSCSVGRRESKALAAITFPHPMIILGGKIGY